MYKIKLEQFEGPLDLLLFFIKRDELEIKDIPIARITDEFLEYLHYLEMLDLDIASDFIVMAATLMQIKVKMLLPKPLADEGEEEDPRAELIRQLFEYKRFKEAAEEMSLLEEERRQRFFRQNFFHDKTEKIVEEDDALNNVTLFHLIAAFKRAIENVPKQTFHTIERFNVTVDEQIDFIQRVLSEKKQHTFSELVCSMQEKLRIIVTVLAILEMAKNGIIFLHRAENELDFLISQNIEPSFSGIIPEQFSLN
jgi:segregation and condensation protein A